MKFLRPVLTKAESPAAMQIVACQGGFSESRAICAHYYSPGIPGRDPVDRLCPPDEDQPEPMGIAGQLFPEKKA